MVTRKEDHHEDAARFAAEDLELDRERARDPLRPLVLVLIEQARRKIAKEEREREEGTTENLPARRSSHERP
jgi:hypothetical protein